MKIKKEYLIQMKGNPNRLGFSRYLHDRYGMPIQTAYGKLRRGFVKVWETRGIEDCVRRFDPTYTGDVRDFYANLHRRKKEFQKWMNEHCEMSPATVVRRFRECNFHEWEVRGLEAVYEEFAAQRDTGGEQGKEE